MLYMIHLVDKPGTAETVKATMATHLQYLEDAKAQLVLAGGTRAEDGTTRLGSIFLLNVPNRAAAEAWLAREPFNKAGVFASHTITRMRRGQWHPEHAPKTAEGD
jgi:uncharacterized protein YciI